MSDQRYVQCPDCGWTGPVEKLTVEQAVRSCPVCGDDIEYIDDEE